MPTYGHVILYREGKRIDKRIHRSKLKDAAAKVKQLKANGERVCLVWRTDAGTYPPPGDVIEQREAGMLWCPYCRAWRWFTVPKFVPNTEVGSPEWFMNSMHRQDIKVCRWCHITIQDFWVCKANGIFGQVYGATKRRRKRRTR